MGVNGCAEPSYADLPAHDALVDQLCRLRTTPWDEASMRALVEDDGQADELARVEAELERKKAAAKRLVQQMVERGDEPTEEEMATYRAVLADLHAEIKALEEQRIELSAGPTSLADLRGVHEALTCLLQNPLWRTGHTTGAADLVREYLQQWIASAVIDQRVVAGQKQWLHARVTWTKVVGDLMRAGLVELAPDVEAPQLTTVSSAAKLAYDRAYRAAKRAELGAARS
jgi:hypothetical protein